MGVYGVILVKPKSNEYYNSVDVEVPLTLDDILMTNGSVYPYNDHETFALMGRYGNVTFVNGKTDYNLDLNKGQIVRFFLVYTANARPYNFTIDGHKLKLVGGDSGKYEKESLVNSVIISPAERQIVEVLFDKPGDFKVLNVTPEKVYQLGMINVSEQKSSSSLPPTIGVNSNSSSSFYTLKENKDIIAQIQSYKKIFIRKTNIPISSSLPSSLSNLNNFQTNNNMMNNNSLPIGYRVRLCNRCLSGNRLEPISASSVETEALTKVNHMCEAESPASSIQQEHVKNNSTNIINEAQVNLVSYLIQVVNMRIGQKEGGAGVDVHLKAQELNSPKLLLQHTGNKKLPENKSWIKEEDCIDLGNISHSNNVENEKNWAYRVIKEEGTIKMIKINKYELTDFVKIAKATFGVFQVQLDDGRGKRYFIISIKLSATIINHNSV
jgi:hypothetical protein